MGQQNILLRWSHGASIISLRSFQGSPILPFLLLTDYSDETHAGIMNDRATPVPNEILRRRSISWGNVFMIPRRLGKHRDVLLMVISCFSITSFCVFFSKRGRRYCRGQQMKLLRLRLYNGQVSLMFLTNLLISNVFCGSMKDSRQGWNYMYGKQWCTINLWDFRLCYCPVYWLSRLPFETLQAGVHISPQTICEWSGALLIRPISSF